MSKFSIYSKSWIDLVFENKNQNYGAFQIRKKSNETTLLAFCIGISLVAMTLTIPMLLSSLKPSANTDTVTTIEYHDLQLTDYRPTQPEKSEKKVLPVTKKERNEQNSTEITKNVEIVNQKVETKTESATTELAKKSGNDNGGNIAGDRFSNEGLTEKGKSLLSDVIADHELNTTLTVDKRPEFPGGLEAFYFYIGNEFEVFEVEQTINVYVSFVVEKDGNMTDIKVIRSATASIDAEAIRVLKSIRTKWKPGIKDGQYVRTLYRLPIKVKKQ